MLLLANSGGVDGSSLIEVNLIHPLADEASAIGMTGIVDPQARRHKGTAGDQPARILLHSADATAIAQHHQVELLDGQLRAVHEEEGLCHCRHLIPPQRSAP